MRITFKATTRVNAENIDLISSERYDEVTAEIEGTAEVSYEGNQLVLNRVTHMIVYYVDNDEYTITYESELAGQQAINKL